MNKKSKYIRLVVTDIDGVWTDGKFYYSEDGYMSKAFSTYDGMGVELLRKAEIDTANELLSELTSFVLPGGSVINAQFHIARNICRRAERRVISLAKKENVDSINIRYLNRLSDALFVWSRWVSNINSDKENLWDPNQ